MTSNILPQDLDHVLSHTTGLWGELRGKRIFVTGGTGFFGCWILESFLYANERLNLGASAMVLTRNPAAFQKKASHLALHPAVTLYTGDTRTFVFPQGNFPFVIHAAAETNTQAACHDPTGTLDSLVEGTRRTLDFALRCGAEKLLYISSGAVYGKQPSTITHIGEDYEAAAADNHRTIYGQGKQIGELLCKFYSSRHALECKIARCFAFAGPYLPTGSGYAFAQFLASVLAGDAVRIVGDGTPYRTYMYAADLMIWLWTILFRGISCRPYNVGSEREITIAGLAQEMVDTLRPGLAVKIALTPVAGKAVERYVPLTQRARSELGLSEYFDLRETIESSARWQKHRPNTG